jgi:hypothetical protein
MDPSTLISLLAFAVASPPAFPADSASLDLRLIRYDLDARIDYAAEQIAGTARLTVRNAGDTAVAAIPIVLYRLMSVDAVTDSAGEPLAYTQRIVSYEDEPKRQVNAISVSPPAPLPAGGAMTFVVRYGGYLLGYAETGSLYVRDHVDPAFTIMRDDAFAFPSLGYPSNRANAKHGLQAFDYVARLTVPDSLWVANGGRLRGRQVANGLATFVYENVKPAWRMDFAVAPYRVLDSGALHVVYFPNDSTGARRILAAAQRCLALYSRRFGPLTDGGDFTIIEVPDGYGSQADVSSIIQTAAAFADPSQQRQLYHEISHLWDVPPDEPFSPRLNEGLATFLEYSTADLLDGTAALDARLDLVRRWLQGMIGKHPELRATPLAEYGRAGLTDFSYSMGMLLFAVMHDVLGDAGFDAIVRGCHAVRSAGCTSLKTFVELAEGATPVDLHRFFADWVYSTHWTDAVVASTSMADLAAPYRAPAR